MNNKEVLALWEAARTLMEAADLEPYGMNTWQIGTGGAVTATDEGVEIVDPRGRQITAIQKARQEGLAEKGLVLVNYQSTEKLGAKDLISELQEIVDKHGDCHLHVSGIGLRVYRCRVDGGSPFTTAENVTDKTRCTAVVELG